MRQLLTCWLLLTTTLFLGCESGGPVKEPPLLMGEPLQKRAELGPPDKLVKFETSKGEFVIGVYKNWSPKGADHFLELVETGFYDDCRFFRVVPGFMVQWGINGDPSVMKKWRDANIPDDHPTGDARQSNQRGFVTFAKSGAPNSRTTQLFINYGDNGRLDLDGFTPFGKIMSGMEVVDAINSKNLEKPDQGAIQERGNEYLNKAFPDLDYIKTAQIMDSQASGPPGGQSTNQDESSGSNDPTKSNE